MSERRCTLVSSQRILRSFAGDEMTYIRKTRLKRALETVTECVAMAMIALMTLLSTLRLLGIVS